MKEEPVKEERFGASLDMALLRVYHCLMNRLPAALMLIVALAAISQWAFAKQTSRISSIDQAVDELLYIVLNNPEWGKHPRVRDYAEEILRARAKELPPKTAKLTVTWGDIYDLAGQLATDICSDAQYVHELPHPPSWFVRAKACVEAGIDSVIVGIDGVQHDAAERYADFIPDISFEEPGTFFDGPRERELAQKLWDWSGEHCEDYEFKDKVGKIKGVDISIHEIAANSLHTCKQVVIARDFLNCYRSYEYGPCSMKDADKQKFVQQTLGLSFLPSGKDLGNTAHFYDAALLGTIGGPVGGLVLGGVGSFLWDIILSPGMKEWGRIKQGRASGQSWVRAYLNSGDVEAAKYDLKQATGYDARGTFFGSLVQIFNPKCRLARR